MLSISFRSRYECDRCHKVCIYIHKDGSWRPTGWVEIVEKPSFVGGAETRHLCPTCAERVFGPAVPALDPGDVPGRPDEGRARAASREKRRPRARPNGALPARRGIRGDLPEPREDPPGTP